MLNRVEAKVMSYIFEKCQGQQKVLLTPKELLVSLLPKNEITVKQLDVIMKNLTLDDYITCERGDKDGKAYFLVSLTLRGAAFDRELELQHRDQMNSLLWKVALAIIAGVISVVVGQIILRIFF